MTSRGNFLSSPCKVCWHKDQRRWKWEKLEWFQDMGFYTFATYVEQRLETQVSKLSIRSFIHALSSGYHIGERTESIHEKIYQAQPLNILIRTFKA